MDIGENELEIAQPAEMNEATEIEELRRQLLTLLDKSPNKVTDEGLRLLEV